MLLYHNEEKTKPIEEAEGNRRTTFSFSSQSIRRSTDPPTFHVRSLVQNANVLRFLRRNALRSRQTRPQMRW